MERVQKDVNPSMRGILVDWLIEVNYIVKQHSEILWLFLFIFFENVLIKVFL